MDNRQSTEVKIAARQSNQKSNKPCIIRLVEQFVAELSHLAGEDWKNSDGWMGRLILCGDEGKQTYVYEMKDGKLCASDSTGPFLATITMSVGTFLDLVEAAPPDISGRAELAFQRERAARYIAYEGERWTVDSEWVHKIFRRMGSTTWTRK